MPAGNSTSLDRLCTGYVTATKATGSAWGPPGQVVGDAGLLYYSSGGLFCRKGCGGNLHAQLMWVWVAVLGLLPSLRVVPTTAVGQVCKKGVQGSECLFVLVRVRFRLWTFGSLSNMVGCVAALFA